MLSREQIYTLLMLRKRENNRFSRLPIELIQEISEVGQDPNSDIAKALHHAAYARQEDVTALLEMLEANPRLLLQAGNVITPGGDEIRRITIYEFLLGAGDYELAEGVQNYFSKIEHGEPQRIRQYERYRPHIEGMLTQEPYDLEPLINLIKEASAENVDALLNKDMTHGSVLRDAIVQFRKDWAPRIVTKACMHYNYASLQHAFDILDREWDNLYQTSDVNLNKIRLVWRQLIGFEMRRLPGIDRCTMAQGLYYVTEQLESVDRSYKFKNSLGDFPIVASDDSLDGLGGGFAINLWGEARMSVVSARSRTRPRRFGMVWKTYVEQKRQNCSTYAVISSMSIDRVCNSC